MQHIQASPRVVGYLASNWLTCNTENPAIVVNPHAEPLDLLAWCWGEMMSLQAAAHAVGAMTEPLSVGDFSAIFLQKLDPLVEVLNLAVDQLHARKAVQS